MVSFGFVDGICTSFLPSPICPSVSPAVTHLYVLIVLSFFLSFFLPLNRPGIVILCFHLCIRLLSERGKEEKAYYFILS